MIKKLLLTIALLLPLGAFAQQSFTPSLYPFTDSQHYIGTTTGAFGTKAYLRIIADSFYDTDASDGCASWSSNVLTSTGVACGSGSGGGSGNVATSSAETSGRVPFWSSTGATPATLSGGVAGFTWTNASSLLTATNLSSTNATSTNLDVTGLITFDGVTADNWPDFCIAITGDSGLCDGSDAVGSGGSGLATSTAIADTEVIYGTSASDVGSEPAFTYNDATNLLTVDALSLGNGTSTNFFSTTASSTNLFGQLINGFSLSTCQAGSFLTWASGSFGCDTDDNTTYTFGDALTLTAGDVDFDGGATPAGDLGGTWASPSVDDDSHAHTGTTLSGIDISDDTNLTGDTEIVLTGDVLSIGSAIARDSELHSAVTLTGEDYASLSGQQITFADIDAANINLADNYTWTGTHIFDAITRSTTTQATTTNFFSTSLTATTGFFTNLFIGADTIAEYIADTAGAMFTGNTETGISVTYQDADNTVDFVVSNLEDLAGTLDIGSGGTGATSLTDHGVLVGSGTGAITPLSVGTNGQLLVGSTGADPVFATLNCADGLTCTTGAGTLEIDFDGGNAPLGELGGTWASPTLDDNVTVTGWTLGNATSTTFAISGIASGNCLQTTTGGAIISAGAACGSGSGGGNSKFATTSTNWLAPNGGNNMGLLLGTTTPLTIAQFQMASNTPYAFITNNNAGTDKKHYWFSNMDGIFRIGTSTDAMTNATSSGFAYDQEQGAGISVGTTTASTVVNLGANTSSTNGTSTIMMGKIQYDGYNSAGARTCAYIVGTAWVITAGACTN